MMLLTSHIFLVKQAKVVTTVMLLMCIYKSKILYEIIAIIPMN